MVKNKDLNEKCPGSNEVFAVNTPKAAKILGCSEALLRKFRSEGTGPSYVRLGTKIVYPIAELERHLKNNLVK